VGEIQNKGFEITLGMTPYQSRNLSVDLTALYSHNTSTANDLGGEKLQIGSSSWRQWAREGYPVPAHFATKVMNPNEIADPITESDQYYGPSYPVDNIGFSASINFLQRFTLYAMGEGSYGHYHMAAVGRQGAARNITLDDGSIHQLWPTCNVSNPDEQTALWRSQCQDKEWASWIIPADFFKLRTISLTYDMPENLIPGTSSSILTVAAQNLWKWTDYQGLDPELSRGDVALAVREYYHIPMGTTLTASLRVVF
jgi:hypothetical protein